MYTLNQIENTIRRILEEKPIMSCLAGEEFINKLMKELQNIDTAAISKKDWSNQDYKMLSNNEKHI